MLENLIKIGYHLVRGKPVIKSVGYSYHSIGNKKTYWISFSDMNKVTPEYLKNYAECIANRMYK